VPPGNRTANWFRRRRAFRLDDMQCTVGLFPHLGLDTAAGHPVTGLTVILTGHTQHPLDVFDVSELNPGGLSVVPADLPERTGEVVNLARQRSQVTAGPRGGEPARPAESARRGPRVVGGRASRVARVFNLRRPAPRGGHATATWRTALWWVLARRPRTPHRATPRSDTGQSRTHRRRPAHRDLRPAGVSRTHAGDRECAHLVGRLRPNLPSSRLGSVAHPVWYTPRPARPQVRSSKTARPATPPSRRPITAESAGPRRSHGQT
jgi:hypothetical protein